MKVKSKIWKSGENYKVHIRQGLIARIEKILKDNPAAYYYEDKKLIAADYNVSNNKVTRIRAFIKKYKLN